MFGYFFWGNKICKNRYKTLCFSCNLKNWRTQDNVKLLQQLESSFKGTVNLNKYVSKRLIERQNSYWDYLTAQGFHGTNRLFVLSFKDNAVREGHTRYFLPTVEIKDYNVTIDGKIFFWSTSRKWYKNIW